MTKPWFEVPRDLYFGGYKVNCSMERLAECVEDLAEGQNLELEPDFQRHHIWTSSQQTAYVEYVLRGGESSTTLYFNSTSWIGSPSASGSGASFQLVDGLQRYTAITKFIRNEVPAFGSLYKERSGKTRGQPLTIAVNALPTRKEVLEWYLLLNDGGTVHSSEELDRVRELLDGE